MTEEPLPISALEHYRYCPRQCALVLVDGEWEDNVHTVRGARGHRRADTPGHRSERGRRVVRAVPVWSEVHGLSGRADAIELGRDGEVQPVEYKVGSRHGDATEVQLCAQALCLEEMLGARVTRGSVWYSGPRRRVTVAFDEELRAKTMATIAEVRGLRDSAVLPPAPADARCRECQLQWRCLPGLVSDPAGVLGYTTGVLLRCGS